MLLVLFEKLKQNYGYLFIGSFWAIHTIFIIALNSVPTLDVKHIESPPPIVQYFSTILFSMLGAYIMITMARLTYDTLGPKLERDWQNLFKYGVKSFGTLTIIFGDLVTIVALLPHLARIFGANNQLLLWQEYFILFGFPILSVIMECNSRRIKLKYKIPSLAESSSKKSPI